MRSLLRILGQWLKVPTPKETLSARSLYLFKRNNKFRTAIHRIVSSWVFEYFILASIIVSCVVVKNSRSQKGYELTNPYAVLDLCMNIIFGIEALMKIITYSFVMNRRSYLRDKWNIIDFVILIGGATSDLILMFSATEKSVSVKIFRLFRVMRPLRLIVRYDSLKVVLDTIITSFKTLFHVFLLLLLIMVMYAIVGVELFKGTFHTTCADAVSGNISQPVTLCVLNSSGCSRLNNSICKDMKDPLSSVSFDAFGYALLTVVQIITMEDWMFIAYKLNDVKNHVVIYAYFVSLVFLGGYFAAGLLMGVLGNEYLKTKLYQTRQKLFRKKRKSLTGIPEPEDLPFSLNGNEEGDLDKTSQKRRNTKNTVFSLVSSIRRRSFVVKDKLKDTLLPIVKGKWFFWIFTVISAVDIVITSVYSHSSRIYLTPHIYLVSKIIFAILYTIELIMVILARGFKKAYKHGTFIFDCFVWMMIVLEFIIYGILRNRGHYVGLSLARAISLIRVFKYTRFWQQLSLLIKSFFKAVRGTFGLMILLVIVLSVYALLGHQLFSSEKPTEKVDNFNTFWNSFLMTFVLLTGDNWKNFMDTAMNDFNTTFAVLYFISFVIIGNFILVNLFLGIIVDTLVSDYEENMITEEKVEEDANNLNLRNIERLKKLHKISGSTKKPKLKALTKIRKGKSKDESCTGKINEENESSELSSCSDLNENSSRLRFKCPSRVTSVTGDSEKKSENIYMKSSVSRTLSVPVTNICPSVEMLKKNSRSWYNNEKEGEIQKITPSNNLVTTRSNMTGNSPGPSKEEFDLTGEIGLVVETNELDENSDGEPETSAVGLDIQKSVQFENPPDSSVETRVSEDTSSHNALGTAISPSEEFPDDPYRKREDSKVTNAFRSLSIILDQYIEHPIPRHNAFFLFNHHNRFRVNVFSFVTSTPCTILIWCAIVTSSLLLAFQDPLKRNKKTEDIMQIVDYAFTIIFLLEIILKSIAYGFVLGHKKCYLRDPMNMIDTMVVFMAIVNFTLKQFGINNMVQLRMLRAIRVVRIMKISFELKDVINCLFNSIQKICHFLLLYIIINYVYAIIGVMLYKDIMGTCSKGNYRSKVSCEKTGNNTWTPFELSFDNAYQGIVSLFVIGTTDDWFGFLQKILGNPDNSKFMATIFIISFIILMSFLLLQVLTGFVIVGYHKEREKDERFEVLDKTAQECLLAAFNEKPNRSIQWKRRRFREKLFDVISTTWFQLISFTLIVLNTIVLMTQRYKQPVWLDHFQQYSNLVFTIIFSIEIALKFIAVPVRDIIRDTWLLFDALLIFGGWIDIILYELKIASLNTSLFRLFRVARLLKFVGKGGNMRQLFSTFIKSMKSVPTIAILLGLLIYLYAILGMELFGCMQLDLDTRYNRNANFRTFGTAVSLLIRITTLDAWQDIMLACAHPKALTCNLTTNSWQPYFSYFYFSSFILICSFWVTNLFLAVIMDNFVYLTHDISALNLCHVQAFVAHWNRYDRHGTGYIKTDDLISLLKRLDPPLGKGMFCPNRYIYGKLTRLKIPVKPEEVVEFDEVLLLLVIDAFNLQASNELIRHEIHLLIPNISEHTLDRIIPIHNHEPTVFNATENRFYMDCAAHVITGHLKIYTKDLQRRRTPLPGGNSEDRHLEYSQESMNNKR